MSAPEVAAGDAIARVAGGDAVLIDVREQGEWDRGHSPAARLVPMSAIQSRVDELPTDQPLYIVCHSGIRSAQVADALDRAGFDASSVAGGMIAVQAAGGDVVAADGRTPTVD